jgi:hypothetical protein
VALQTPWNFEWKLRGLFKTFKLPISNWHALTQRNTAAHNIQTEVPPLWNQREPKNKFFALSLLSIVARTGLATAAFQHCKSECWQTAYLLSRAAL